MGGDLVGAGQSSVVAPGKIALSIVVPAYNAALTLPRTLSSLACVAASDRPRVQVIVVDDGSTDTTMEAIGEWAGRLTDFVWTVLRQPNCGVAAARNRGLEAVRGEWILLLDADDELSASPLVELDRVNGVSSMIFPVRYCRPNVADRIVRPRAVAGKRIANLLSAGNPYPICSLIFRADSLDSAFDASLRYLEDWKFWWDNPRVFANCRNVPSGPLATIYIHGANRTSHFEQTAAYRERIARMILEQESGTLSRQQRNNFRLHIGIAKAARRATSFGLAIPRIPCSWQLYIKLLLFVILGPWVRVFDRYR